MQSSIQTSESGGLGSIIEFKATKTSSFELLMEPDLGKVGREYRMDSQEVGHEDCKRSIVEVR